MARRFATRIRAIRANRFLEIAIFSYRARDSHEWPPTCDSQFFNPTKRDSQKRGSVRDSWNDSRESGDSRESANRFARIELYKFTFCFTFRCGIKSFSAQFRSAEAPTPKTLPHYKYCAIVNLNLLCIVNYYRTGICYGDRWHNFPGFCGGIFPSKRGSQRSKCSPCAPAEARRWIFWFFAGKFCGNFGGNFARIFLTPPK